MPSFTGSIHSLSLNDSLSLNIHTRGEDQMTLALMKELFEKAHSYLQEASTEIELMSSLMLYIAANIESIAASQFEKLCEMLMVSTKELLRKSKVPSLHHAIKDSPTRDAIICAYYKLYSYSSNIHQGDGYNVNDDALSSNVLAAKLDYLDLPAIFNTNSNAKVCIQFSGQGSTTYMDELSTLYNTYYLIRPFLKDICDTLVHSCLLSPEGQMMNLHPFGIDFISWINGTTPMPSKAALISSPYSYPLVCVTQIAHYYKMVTSTSLSFTAIRDAIVSGSGHSQGVAAALVISASQNKSDFIHLSKKMIALQFWHGSRVQEFVGIPDYESLEDSSKPTHMLRVAGLTEANLSKILDSFFRGKGLAISLHNGMSTYVVSGPPSVLALLQKKLMSLSAKKDEDQGKVPFSLRKLLISTAFLPVSAPFHHFSLVDIENKIINIDLVNLNFSLEGDDLHFPVYGTDQELIDFKNSKKGVNVIPDLIRLQTSKLCKWERPIDNMLADNVTHILDFGPSVGAATLTKRILVGSGIKICSMNTFDDYMSFLSHSVIPKASIPNWTQKYGPNLVMRKTEDSASNKIEDKIFISNKWTDIVGRPPIMVAGMTPTTSYNGVKLVAAATNAGYFTELACGGLPTLEIFKEKIYQLLESITPGESIKLNMLYLSPHFSKWQFPALRTLRAEGVPIESITIGAGVPSIERGKELLTELVSIGIKYICLKPGGVEDINRCIDLARTNPEMYVVIQWTGGRGGGHHSYEDMHAPIIQTYSNIRSVDNILLVAGSGLGDSEGAWPYLSGKWSEKFYCQPMPFDCILLGSRMMVAKEAATATAVKELLCKASVAAISLDDEKKWEQSYSELAGPVITVKSEMREPIHKIANKGMMLWRELDATIFNLDKKELPLAIAKNKNHIIERINKVYQKPYFPRHQDQPNKIIDLGDMSFYDVAFRFIQTCFVDPKNEVEFGEFRHENWTENGRWLDPSYLKRLISWVDRIESHFSNEKTSFTSKNVELFSNTPFVAISLFLEKYPQSKTHFLGTNDVDAFIHLCRFNGKPVPFIPIIDESLEFWFKKDSLWYSEDLAAVPDQDADRVCILQGPISVGFNKEINIPAAIILEGINKGLIEKIKHTHPFSALSVNSVDYVLSTHLFNSKMINIQPSYKFKDRSVKGKGCVGSYLSSIISSSFAEVSGDYTNVSFNDDDLPSLDEWFVFLSGNERNWINAIISSDYIVSNKLWVPNRVRYLIRPKKGQSVTIFKAENQVNSFIVVKNNGSSAASLIICFIDSIIHVILRDNIGNAHSDLVLRFAFLPSQSYMLIHELNEGKGNNGDCIRSFYWSLWISGSSNQAVNTNQIHKCSTIITNNDISKFNLAIGNKQKSKSTSLLHSEVTTSIDFTIAACWEPLIKCLFAVKGNLLNLVHLSNSYKLLQNVRTSMREPLTVSDVLHCAAEISEIRILPTGKSVTVKCNIQRSTIENKDKLDYLELVSSFFFRGKFDDFDTCFRKSSRSVVLEIKDIRTLNVLESKNEWFCINSENKINIDDVLEVQVSIVEKFKSANIYSEIDVQGTISRRSNCGKPSLIIGNVKYNENSRSNMQGNVVTAFFDRWETREGGVTMFGKGGYTLLKAVDVISAPTDNTLYAHASKDLNPIHRNSYFADYAGLPSTIVHGMWTSSNGRRVVEAVAGQPQLIHSYSCTFESMVNPGDKLYTQVTHIGNKKGRKILLIETMNDDKVVVLKGRAEIDLPRTAFVFTGQGSAEPGMGMDLYNTSKTAKAVWDAAEGHLLKKFGFSILDIVKNNPQTLTVYFGGRQGAYLRQNYLQLLKGSDNSPIVLDNGEIFTETTESYTFFSPSGLLYSTQFTQPALTLVEKAAYDDMKANGLIPSDAFLAGHSLGEYAAISSAGEILSTESLAEIVFLRGMTMQKAVPRIHGRSEYGMVAVDPQRVGQFMTEDHLTKIVAAIQSKSKNLIQVVNYNIRGQQYVVAGKIFALVVLGKVLDIVRNNSTDLSSIETVIQDQVKKTTDEKRSTEMEGGILKLERSKSTIPIPGVDVPFHSEELLSGVENFRKTLNKNIPLSTMFNAYPKLLDLYVPNLVGSETFSVRKCFVEKVFEKTNKKSSILKDVLTNWNEENIKTDPYPTARLVFIELLAFQFASPVEWILTQDFFFGVGDVQRFIEIGPASTLKVMATKTLASNNYEKKLRNIMWYKQDINEIYFDLDNQGPTASEVAGENKKKIDSQVVKSLSSTFSPKSTINSAAVAPTFIPSPPSDYTVNAIDTLKIVVALKLKKSSQEIKLQDSIKHLVGGKSAMQNELIGDLAQEFGSVPENAVEISLDELAKGLGPYKSLGKFTNGLISKLLASKMPGGFGASALKSYLKEIYKVPTGIMEAILLHSLTMAPDVRMTTEDEAKSWTDSVVVSFSSSSGIKVGKFNSNQPMTSTNGASFAPLPPLQPVADTPVTALEFIEVLLAIKIPGIKASEIVATKSIKDFTGGKSAIQNELVGDISKELGDAPDGASDLVLGDLAKSFNGYKELGKVSSAFISKLISGKMPGGFGFSAAKEHLQTERLLGPGRIESVFLHSLTLAPESRFTDENSAIFWLDSVVDSYGAKVGIKIPHVSKGGAGGGSTFMGNGNASGISSKEFSSLEKKLALMLEDNIESHMQYLNKDSHSVGRDLDAEAVLRHHLEKELDLWVAEHGEEYEVGIKPMFDEKKQRTYDSSWNWARVDTLDLFNKIINGEVKGDDVDLTSLINRSSLDVTTICNFFKSKIIDLKKCDQDIVILCEELEAHILKSGKPTYKAKLLSLAPVVTITNDGRIDYSETLREINVDAYIKEMKEGYSQTSPPVQSNNKTKSRRSTSSFHHHLLSIKTLTLFGSREYDEDATTSYFAAMQDMCHNGITFSGKVALVTGCGIGSIAVELVKSLLAGGAHVIATTSNFTLERTKFYRQIFESNCSRSSSLTILPFNQGSMKDVENLVAHIYNTMKLDVEFVIPFASISEQGRDIGKIDGRSELSHRIMLTNTVRLIGAIKNAKEMRGIVTRPAMVLVPLSPNHGVFGGDGLYAESKLALEALLNKWESEEWGDYLSIIGAVIGWTRGTGLMNSNNMVAPRIEKLGLRTFNQEEMAFNLISLFHPSMIKLSQSEPILADLGGGFEKVPNLKGLTAEIRANLLQEASIKRIVSGDNVIDSQVLSSNPSQGNHPSLKKLASVSGVKFPSLPEGAELDSLRLKLSNMVDLSTTVVCVGYGEIGPWGSARTRWEMESYGEFSLEGCVELAWMLGYIKYHNGLLSSGKHHIGWIDGISGEPVADSEVKSLYEKSILESAGIRFIEPKLFDGYDPHKKTFLQHVAVDRDLRPVEVSSKAEAEEYRLRAGSDNCDVYCRDDGVWCVKFRKGAVIALPRALKFDRFVAGQIPTGWNASRLGIPQDIVDQVDPVTLYCIVSTVEALVSAGICDPYEFYKYVHVSEVGNSSGGGMGGMKSLKGIFNGRMMGASLQGDILQESFINVSPAWVNLLLLSSSGPIKTPVGACATAAESVEIAVETIQGGKAQIMICGGYDDFCEEGSYEFANMKATSNTIDELSKGRDPREMSRPCTTTRSGFMESQGAGNQLLMSAKLALEMGVPIYAIVALTSTATDKEGRSIPAPGQGILTTAREQKSFYSSRLLDISYRRKQIERELSHAEEWNNDEKAQIDSISLTESIRNVNLYKTEAHALREREFVRIKQTIQNRWGNRFYINEPTISPIRGALSVWGLGVDDIAISSFHGTSTKLNDINESEVTNRQMEHLGRSKGNPLYVIAQKSLTGHPKGAAAAWMFNGCVQAMQDSIIPGNFNLDTVDEKLKKYEHLVYPNRYIKVGNKINAAILKSFGFGQAGAEILLIHPDNLFGAVEVNSFEIYKSHRLKRFKSAFRFMQDVLASKHTLVQVKHAAPYTPAEEMRVYLDPTIRAQYDSKEGTYVYKRSLEFNPNVDPPSRSTSSYTEEEGEISVGDSLDAYTGFDRSKGKGVSATLSVKQPSVIVPQSTTRRLPGSAPLSINNIVPQAISHEIKLQVALSEMSEGLMKGSLGKGVGVDSEPFSTFTNKSSDFLARNFTDAEIEYCQRSADSAASFAGRWAAKEATIKALSNSSPESENLWKSSGAPLKGIEVVPSLSGAPTIKLSGHAADVAAALGVDTVKISISHSGEYALALAFTK